MPEMHRLYPICTLFSPVKNGPYLQWSTYPFVLTKAKSVVYVGPGKEILT